MPVSILVVAKSVSEAWQRAIARVLREGDDIKTEYDKPSDPSSKDAYVVVEITEPFSDPIQRRGKVLKIRSKFGNEYEVYGCLSDTYLVGSVQSGYIEEITEGVNDKFLWESSGSFPYSYHDRIFSYIPYGLEDTNYAHYDVMPHKVDSVRRHKKLKVKDEKWEYRPMHNIDLVGDKSLTVPFVCEPEDGARIPLEMLKFSPLNQMKRIEEKLRETPYSRRCQFTTWRPFSDPFSPDPPCLQRGQFRVMDGRLRLFTHWRSRDLYRAWEANVNGMLHLQRALADKLSVDTGAYVDQSNSLHIYGSTFSELLSIMESMQKRGDILSELEEQIEPLRELVY